MLVSSILRVVNESKFLSELWLGSSRFRTRGCLLDDMERSSAGKLDETIRLVVHFFPGPMTVVDFRSGDATERPIDAEKRSVWLLSGRSHENWVTVSLDAWRHSAGRLVPLAVEVLRASIGHGDWSRLGSLGIRLRLALVRGLLALVERIWLESADPLRESARLTVVSRRNSWPVTPVSNFRSPSWFSRADEDTLEGLPVVELAVLWEVLGAVGFLAVIARAPAEAVSSPASCCFFVAFLLWICFWRVADLLELLSPPIELFFGDDDDLLIDCWSALCECFVRAPSPVIDMASCWSLWRLSDVNIGSAA